MDEPVVQCFHCGLPVPVGSHFRVRIAERDEPMCCRGCEAVAQTIVDNHLADYYRNRTSMPASGSDVVPEALEKLLLFDHPEIQRSFVIQAGEHTKEAVLILEGITCAACVWLNERHLRQLDGMLAVNVNYSSHRAHVTWDTRHIQLSTILHEIQLLGYNAHPYSAHGADQLRKQRRKKDLQRLAISGIAAAQVMMLAVALYAGGFYGIDVNMQRLLRWFSLLLTLPVITFAAMPFYRAAWSGIKSGHLNMDVPVALAILSAFLGSVWTTFMGGTQVYYDTVSMFTLFLLATRLLETGAQEKSIEAAENLLKLQPAMANRIRGDRQEYVPVMELCAGDEILVKPGETIAADGAVVEGQSSANEALLTGESRPVEKTVGAKVIAGSMNLDSPMRIRVEQVGEHTVLAGIVRLVDKAQAEKPKLAQMADIAAGWFTWALLIFATLVCAFWWWHDKSRVFEIVLSVLVVTCPCALSLAVPAALAAAGSHLIKQGILVTRSHVLETLSQVNHVVFDKTGTLTLGVPRIAKMITFADVPAHRCQQLAASLEQQSEHPVARAFLQQVSARELLVASQLHNMPGKGVAGVVAGETYRLGNRTYAGDEELLPPAGWEQQFPGATLVWLRNAQTVLALFVLQDGLRTDAKQAMERLTEMGVRVSVLSGDEEQAVAAVATQIGVKEFHASQTPADKLAVLRRLQQNGEVVAMVGDGVNDAPVLAGAQVSFAMGTGVALTSQNSDIVLLSSRLVDVVAALETGMAARQVMRQNLWWALAYNVLALPFAAMGYISPWLAALGMSMSSLIVVLNALRLR